MAQISAQKIAEVAHEHNEKLLKDALKEIQTRLQRLESDVSREIYATVCGKPHADDIVELATYRITHEVIQCLGYLYLDTLTAKAARFAVSRERLEQLEVERLRVEEAQ